jgi:hypothetical protein
MDDQDYQHLSARGTLREQAFHSDLPVIGPLVVWFRETWNSISTKWYVRPLVQQQNEFNALVVLRFLEVRDRISQVQAQVNLVQGHLDETDVRLVETDRGQVELRRDLAELTLQVIQMNRSLDELNERLVRPEDK